MSYVILLIVPDKYNQIHLSNGISSTITGVKVLELIEYNTRVTVLEYNYSNKVNQVSAL